MRDDWCPATLVVAIALTLAGGGERAEAALSLVPSATSVDAGGSLTLALGISDLDSPGDSLKAFTIKLAFDETLFAFTGAVFGDALGGPACPSGSPGPCGSLTTQETAGGEVALTNTSLLADLSGQANAFSLATLTFQALVPPMIPTLGDILLVTDLFTELVMTDNGAPATLYLAPFPTPLPTVTIAVLPEPGTALLLGLGLACLAGRAGSRTSRAHRRFGVHGTGPPR